MWGFEFSDLLMVLVYAALAICVAVLISVRVRKKRTPRPDRQKTHVPAPADGKAYVLNGRYALIAPPFKQGGMATIWRAVERRTGRPCIIKTPRRGTAMDNVYLEKLLLEASFLKRLGHPGIVKYIDDFYHKGEFHLVLEYLNGETLLALSPRSPLQEQQVVLWACELLDALYYIHRAGIIHRDVNPKNIMLCSDGTVKLIDFGTAKDLDPDKDKTHYDSFTQITNRGFDIPELFIGRKSDHRCDLCGLAQTCIYLLTLDEPNDICQHLFRYNWPRSFTEAALLADYLVSAGVSKRVAKCLAQAVMFSPDSRFANARAMQAALASESGYLIKQLQAVSQK
jgi:serine/threonine protein kinase